MASARIRYINTASTAGGNGTTNNTSGATRAYATMAGMVSSESKTLTASDVYLYVYATGSDTTEVNFTGFTTDATRYIVVDGQGTYTLYTTSYQPGLKINQQYLTIKSMSIRRNGASTIVAAVDINSGNVTIEKCRIFSGASHTRDSGSGAVEVISVTSGTITVRNNFIYDCIKHGIYWGIEGGESMNIYNNTVVDCADVGIKVEVLNTDAGCTKVMKNNICYSNTTADFSIGPTMTTAGNLSSDTSSPQSGLRSKSLTFVDLAGKDYHLISTDTAAIDVGDDLSASFTDDFDGVTRSGTWDAGADEYVSVGGQPTSKRFGGLNHNALTRRGFW